MNILKVIMPIVLLLNSSGNTDWKLRKDDSEILIYTRRIEGSDFDEFKGIVKILNTTVAAVLDTILDVKSYTTLISDCIEAKILLQKGKYYDIHYIEIKAPWPVKNRDSVHESTAIIGEDGKFAEVLLEPKGSYMEEKKDKVRVYVGSGFWRIEADNDNNVTVTYQFHAEPGGQIPAWLANSVVVSNPFKTLLNLRKKFKD